MQKDLYFIALILPEPLLSEVEALKQLLHTKYGTKAALKAPAHITLFPPFRLKNITEKALTEALVPFAPLPSGIEITLNGFGQFGQQTIFIQPLPDQKLNDLHAQIEAIMIRLGFAPEERSFHPHVTVGNRDWNGHFDEAWKDFSPRPFHGRTTLERADLLKLVNGKWEICPI